MRKKTTKQPGASDVNLQLMVRRLAEDWEREALAVEKETCDRNNDVSHAIRWCRRQLLSENGKSPNNSSAQTR